MGCIASSSLNDSEAKQRVAGGVGDGVYVFVPGFRVPKAIDFSPSSPLGSQLLSGNLSERLSTEREAVISIIAQDQEGAAMVTRTRRRKIKAQKGASTLVGLHSVLEDYLSLLCGLIRSENLEPKRSLNFAWLNREDVATETSLPNVWYEVLSVLQLMAMLKLSHANFLLTPKSVAGSVTPQVSDDCKRETVDIFLQAAGYLDYGFRHVLPQLPDDSRKSLPVDLCGGVLQALCLQAMAQCVDVQLGMAIDDRKANLAVKRRLACEMSVYWEQAREHIMILPLKSNWGKKHVLFVSWKYLEAKAAAYFYHGLFLNAQNADESHPMSMAAFRAANDALFKSSEARDAFNAASPQTATQLPWGTMRHLWENIPERSVNGNNFQAGEEQQMFETAPGLPAFPLSLKPDQFELPMPVSPTKKEDVTVFQETNNKLMG